MEVVKLIIVLIIILILARLYNRNKTYKKIGSEVDKIIDLINSTDTDFNQFSFYKGNWDLLQFCRKEGLLVTIHWYAIFRKADKLYKKYQNYEIVENIVFGRVSLGMTSDMVIDATNGVIPSLSECRVNKENGEIVEIYGSEGKGLRLTFKNQILTRIEK